jgi:hypothetical protein
VTLRRIASAASTIAIAIIVALAVPVSQLRTITVVKSCCCPDPAKCHCPDHKPDHGGQPAMRACHNTQQIIVAPELPTFTPPVLAVAAAPQLVAIALAMPLRSPHAPPSLARPDGPS